MSIVKKVRKSIKNKKYKVKVNRLETKKDDAHFDIGIKKVMNLLNYTKKSSVSYSAGNFSSGYHSFVINKY